MAFPTRLTAKLACGLALRALGAKRKPPLIFTFATNGNSRAVAASIGSPIVWIGGAEPLEQPEIPSVANALASCDRYVFLQANALLLRRRLHEFQPGPRLFLTVRFDGTEPAHDAHADQAGAFRSALEGIRAARLSGFLTCAQLMAHADRTVGELRQLHAQLRKLDLDGFLISPASAAADLQPLVAAARYELLSYRWALFSRLLDSARLPASATVHESSPALATPLAGVSSPTEEGLRVP